MPLPTTIEILKERLRLSKQTVGSQPGPLPVEPKAEVEAHLDFVKGSIASILEEIGEVGTANQSLPESLPEIAELCETLADSALRQATVEPVEYEGIGDALKTVDYLIDANEGYKDRAGIA